MSLTSLYSHYCGIFAVITLELTGSTQVLVLHSYRGCIASCFSSTTGPLLNSLRSTSDDLRRLEPQLALMQPMPVTRITKAELRRLGVLTSLSRSGQRDRNGDKLHLSILSTAPQQCRCHHLKEIVWSNLQIFPYNYEVANT
jgi:hypothetical protein